MRASAAAQPEDPGAAHPRKAQDSARHTDRLAWLCHDLRQCLATSQLLAEVGADEEGLPSSVAMRLRLLREQLAAMGSMIAAEVDEGPRPRQALDIAAVVQSCCTIVTASGAVQVRADIAARPVVFGAEAALRRALNNLLDNAARATVSGLIDIWVGLRDGRAWVEVADDGPGFGRISPGTGIGLEQVRAVASAHGGDVHVGVSRYGGTLVSLTLPAIVRRAA